MKYHKKETIFKTFSILSFDARLSKIQFLEGFHILKLSISSLTFSNTRFSSERSPTLTKKIPL